MAQTKGNESSHQLSYDLAIHESLDTGGKFSREPGERPATADIAIEENVS